MKNEPTKAEASTLGTALPAEMARVRDHVLPYYTPEVNGQFAAAAMRRDLDAAAKRRDLDAAAKAMAEGDTIEMLRVHEALKGWNT